MTVVFILSASDALSQRLLCYWGFSYLGRAVSPHGCSSRVQLLLLTLDVGYLLLAAAPDLGCGVSPLGLLLPKSSQSALLPEKLVRR